MRKNVIYVIVTLLAFAATTFLPWLAFQEAQRQALAAESKLALAYARAVRYRADELGRQAESVINRVAQLGYVPCSNEARALLYEIDLTSTYLQAIGYVRNGMLVCSSLGDLPTPLGSTFFRTSNGARLYLDVPLGHQTRSALIAIEQNGIAVIAHRDLPLDTWMEKSGVSVAVIHLERPKSARPAIARGHIDSNWAGRLGSRGETTFVDRGYLVAIVRSVRIPSVAIAALPLSDVHAQTNQIAARLVPAGFVTGLVVASMLLLLTRRQLSVASALRYALRNNEFFLLYQPLIDLSTGRYVGVEALLRMRRGTGELIGPDLFIPIAEETGLITRLTERVIQLIEQDTGNFLALHPDFHISINISADDLQSDKLLYAIDRFFERTGATPSNLIVEITERGFIDLALARPALAALRARGILVAVDDFGTGYSSLSYLESLDLDLLKIDRSFIQTIGTGAPTSQVVGHIIAMAKTIGLRMIAEGIETQEQAAFVAEQGVEYAQGWLFGRPTTFDKIEEAFVAQSGAPS